jgi:hypothetical protein
MLKLKSEVWTNARGKRFVVVPEDDFARITELLEDRGLSRILKEAKGADTGKPGIPFAEVKKQLAAQRRGKSSNRP